MKFLLVFTVCSMVNGNCLDTMSTGKKFYKKKTDDLLESTQEEDRQDCLGLTGSLRTWKD